VVFINYSTSPPATLAATDFFNVHLQNFAQTLGVGFGLGGFGERLMHPIQRLADRHRHGRVGQTVIHPSLRFAGLDEAGVMEDGEVLGDGGRREAEQFRDLADAQFPAAERQQNPHAARVGQRLGDGHEFSHIYISSNNEMTITPKAFPVKRNIWDMFYGNASGRRLLELRVYDAFEAFGHGQQMRAAAIGPVTFW
jgi:hypothetical protein